MIIINHSGFFSEIKSGNLRPIYLFHGDEEYVKEKAYNMLVDTVLPQFKELNISVFNSATADEITSACETVPFMADKRIITVTFIPKDADSKIIIDYISNIPKESIIVFYIKGKADGKTSLVKTLKSIGAEVLFDFLDIDETAKWIVKKAIEEGCSIGKSDAVFMINLVGKDIMSISNELKKLCDYVGENGVISREIISNIVIKNLEFQLYNCYSYFVNGKQKDGFLSLEAITNGKDRDSEAFGIAGYFLSCMKATLVTYDLLKIKASQAELEAKTGKKGYALKDLQKNASRFTRQQLLKAIESFSDITRQKIMFGRSSFAALYDSIISTFSHIK